MVRGGLGSRCDSAQKAPQSDPRAAMAIHSFNSINGKAEENLRAALSHIQGLDLDLRDVKD